MAPRSKRLLARCEERAAPGGGCRPFLLASAGPACFVGTRPRAPTREEKKMRTPALARDLALAACLCLGWAAPAAAEDADMSAFDAACTNSTILLEIIG